MWIVMIAQRFDAMEFGSNWPPLNALAPKLRVDNEPYMYLPVFGSYEAAVKWNGGEDNGHIMEVRAAVRPQGAEAST